MAGHYFDDHEDIYTSRDDNTTGTTRAWGLGPRVPLYVVSPWSKGGWVNSEVFDHTSVGRFLERRFGVTIPAISPWHRAVCGDLTSCFDFAANADAQFPELPDVSGSAATIAVHQARSRLLPPRQAQDLYQEPGVRRSRALPYRLAVDALGVEGGEVRLRFVNEGQAGAVFHVYDRKHLERIPRRYTVEAGKRIDDGWTLSADGGFDLWVLGPNGFLRHFRKGGAGADAAPPMTIRQHRNGTGLLVALRNAAREDVNATVGRDAYATLADREVLVPSGGEAETLWRTDGNHGWYDFTVTLTDIEVRVAGRIERGQHGVSDPLMALHTARPRSAQEG